MNIGSSSFLTNDSKLLLTNQSFITSTLQFRNIPLHNIYTLQYTITTQLLHYYPRPFNCLPRQISASIVSPRSYISIYISTHLACHPRFFSSKRCRCRDESPFPKDGIRSVLSLYSLLSFPLPFSLPFFVICISTPFSLRLLSLSWIRKKTAQGSLEVITSGNKRGCIKSAASR